MYCKKWALGCALIALSATAYFTQAIAQPPEAGSKESKSDSGPADFCQCVDQGDSAAVAHIEKALAAPLHSPGLDFSEQPLQEVAATIGDDYNIPIQLDRPALDEAAIASDIQVSISLHNISLRSALRLMLKRLQLTFIIQDEVLLITTKDVADHQLVTCVYNLQGVVDGSDPESTKSLVKAITSCVATDTWAANGGTNADAVPIKPGLLLVSQTPAIQDEVKAVLMKIRSMREHAPIPKARAKEPAPAQKPSLPGTSDQNKKAVSPNAGRAEDNPFGG